MSKEIQHISSRIHDYELMYETDFSFIHELLLVESAFYVIDKQVFELYQEHFSTISENHTLLLIGAREENKTLQYAEAIIDQLISLNPTKKTTLISIGGGITQDLTGFVASTFFRGIKWIYVPTTLLAQADSCMGSKTSLNYKSYKNILGTFYPPHHVYICPLFTETLTNEDFYSGMGEVVKLHVMGGIATLDNFIDQLPAVHQRNQTTLASLIKESLRIKWSFMENDEFDTGKRSMLNYGHCFGHAIETATNYTIPHGQAVIIGMILSNHIALQKEKITKETYDKIAIVFYDLLHCDHQQLKQIDLDTILLAMKQDKKRVGNQLPLIWMNEQYTFEKIVDLTEVDARATIKWFIQTHC